MVSQYLSVYGLEASALTFSMTFSYFYLSLISEIQEELKREIPWLYHRGSWFTKNEAMELKKRVNKRFWEHVKRKLAVLVNH